MPLWIAQVLLAVTILVTAITAIWLLINLQAVARLFRNAGEIEPGPGRRRASRRTTLIMLVAFNLGWIGSIAIWSWAMTDQSNQMVDARV